jgi:hypothetical protein
MTQAAVASEESFLGAPRRASRLVLWAAVLVLVPNLLVFGVRLANTVSKGSFIETTGTEPVPIYGVWKAQHGYPVYEQPFRDNFAVSLYNFAFYHSYGFVARLFGWEGGGLILGARVLTAVATASTAAVCAWIITLGIGRPAAPRQSMRSTWAFASIAGTATCLSSAGVSWFYLTVRPDMAAMLFAMLGLALYLASEERPGWRLLLVASLCFFAAWSIKQSTIGILGGVCCSALLARRWRDVLILGAPAATLAVVCLLVGSADYRFNVMVVPGLGAFDGIRHSYPHLLSVFLPNAYMWAAPVAMWGRGQPHATLQAGHEGAPHRSRLRALGVVALVSFAWCLVALTRDGGYRNSLLEAYLSASLLAWVVLWQRVPTTTDARMKVRRTVLATAVLVTAAFPIAQLVALDRIGNLTVASQGTIDEARRIAERLRSMPKPIFVEESMFAEPWHSTDNRYPAVVLDNYFFFSVRARGGTNDAAGIEGLVAGHRFPALLLSGLRRLEPVALRFGYRRVPLTDGSQGWTLRLYVLDPPGGARGAMTEPLR